VEPDTNAGIDEHAAEVINRVLKNQVNAIGLDRALITSINRANGAKNHMSPEYEELRMKDARDYAGSLATSLRQAAALRSDAVAIFRNIGAVHTFTEDEAKKLRIGIFDKGLPSHIDQIFSQYCLNADEKNSVLAGVVSQLVDHRNLQVTFPDLLSNPQLADAEARAADVLEEFSNST